MMEEKNLRRWFSKEQDECQKKNRSFFFSDIL
jgi:hypothetical protein